MLLVKSLFCVVGRDNGLRFAAIHIGSYCVFLLSFVLFKQMAIAQSVILIALLPIVLASSIRRVNDAGSAKVTAFLPPLVYLLICITVILTDSSASYWLLFLSAAITGVFTLINHGQHDDSVQYLLGYNGPIDLSDYVLDTASSASQRIEPSLHGASVSHNVHVQTQAEKSDGVDDFTALKDGWLDLKVVFKQHWRLVGIVAVFFSLCIFTLLYLGQTNTQTQVEPIVEPIKPVNVLSIPEYEVTFPDEFSVGLNQYQGSIIRWQVTGIDDGEVWNVGSALGKKSCQTIDFNKGKDYRSVSAEVVGSFYQVYFSPIDTEQLIRSLAKQSNFKLCGFDFSLKGSSKQLKSKPQFAQWL